MTRRAFTLVEMALATLVASLVLVSSLSALWAIDRADARLAERRRDAVELSRLRIAGQNAALALLMAEMGGVAGSAVGGAGAARPPASAPAQRPRFILGYDERPQIAALARRLAEESGDPEWMGERAQRLEVVLSAEPIPAAQGAPGAVESSLSGVPDPRLASIFSVRDTGVRVRGVFELWPDGAVPGSPAWAPASRTARDADLRDRGGMTLWWRRLEAAGRSDTPAHEGAPVRLASGLTRCRWRAFHSGQLHAEHWAASALDLPAYVTLDVATVSGVTAGWMFEVGFDVAPDESDVPAGGADDAGGAEGDGPDGGGSRPPGRPPRRGEDLGDGGSR
jgi:hypothetical protein